MLLTCSGCQAQMRVPDEFAGKRVKCPKCGTIVTAPAVEAPPAPPPPAPTPPETGITSSGPLTVEPLDIGFETTPPPATDLTAAPPPPLPIPRDRYDDDPEPPRRDRFGEDMDTQGPGKSNVDNMAMASMILGITGLAFGTIGCGCCSAFGPLIGVVCGVLAVIFGLKGKVPGSETHAKTGIICGAVAIGLGLIGGLAMGAYLVFVFMEGGGF